MGVEIKMTITEWFARAVAAGLMPEWKNVWAIYTKSGWVLRDCQGGKSYYIPVELSPISKSNTIQLRSNSKDLYSLEWRKPTEQDVGKMCWHLRTGVISLAVIKSIKSYTYDKSPEALNDKELVFWCNDCQIVQGDRNSCGYLLLADHGQIAPTEADFKQVYGE